MRYHILFVWCILLSINACKVYPICCKMQDFHYFLMAIEIQIKMGFPHCSDGKESACIAGEPGWIPGLGRSPEEGNGNPLQYSMGSQRVRHNWVNNTQPNQVHISIQLFSSIWHFGTGFRDTIFSWHWPFPPTCSSLLDPSFYFKLWDFARFSLSHYLL